jgi:hypothetical protein
VRIGVLYEPLREAAQGSALQRGIPILELFFASDRQTNTKV